MNFKRQIKKRFTIGNTLKFILIAYLWISAYYGVNYISYCLLKFKYQTAKANIDQVPLSNGFTYITKNSGLMDEKGKVVIARGIYRLAVTNDVVYGNVDNKAPDEFYFICVIGKDCSKTSNYTYQEFEKLRKEKGYKKLYFSDYEDRETLVAKEWLKRKLTFQNAPSSPFKDSPYGNKAIKDGLFFTLYMFFNEEIAIYTYSLILSLVFATLLPLFLVVKKRAKELGNYSKLLHDRKIIIYSAKNLVSLPFKIMIFLMSVIGSFIILMMYIDYYAR